MYDSPTEQIGTGGDVNEDKVKGKGKELEGKLQQRIGEAKEKARDLPDDASARLEREKGKREAKRELERQGRLE